MSHRPLPTRRQAIFTCVACAITVLVCAALMTAAALVPAPHVVIPAAALVCICLPIVAAVDVLASIAVLRASRADVLDGKRALSEMRRRLDRLPETRHPLGL
jgi:hypothetical protein